MKRIVYTREVPTAHPEAGMILPGPNDIADDALADRLLEAGRYTGDYVLPRPPVVEIDDKEQERPRLMRPRRREEKE